MVLYPTGHLPQLKERFNMWSDGSGRWRFFLPLDCSRQTVSWIFIILSETYNPGLDTSVAYPFFLRYRCHSYRKTKIVIAKFLASLSFAFGSTLEMFTVLRCSGSSQRGMRTRGSLHFLARANCGHIFRQSSIFSVSMHHVYAAVVRLKTIIH